MCSPSSSAIPRMPLGEDHPSMHKEKLGFPTCPDNLCVARPVGRKEVASTPLAKASVDKEWEALRFQNVWDEADVREWDDVARSALVTKRETGEDTHVVWSFSICVEKRVGVSARQSSAEVQGTRRLPRQSRSEPVLGRCHRPGHGS